MIRGTVNNCGNSQKGHLATLWLEKEPEMLSGDKFWSNIHDANHADEERERNKSIIQSREYHVQNPRDKRDCDFLVQ